MNWIESIKEYVPYNEQEKKDKEIIISCIDKFDDILTRDNEVIHITSSAFAVNRAKDKVLMVHHNIYGTWSWTGGHADGENDLMAVAIRELMEETGVKNITPVNQKIVSLDILPVLGHVKRGKYVAPHLHASIAYLVKADENEPLVIKPDENSGVKWIPIESMDIYSNEPHMKRIYHKIADKMRAIGRDI